jgi:penicillin amidase
MIHITAQNDHDLMVAQGVVRVVTKLSLLSALQAAAQDRLFQMEFMRRIGRGTLCEIVGSAALPIDKFSRTVGFYKAAQLAAHNITGPTLNMLEAYIQV